MYTENSLYTQIFKFYGLDKCEENRKKGMRYYLIRHLKKEFPQLNWKDPQQSWDNLPTCSKVRFTCIVIKEQFFKYNLNYNGRFSNEQIERKIKEELNKHLIHEQNLINNYNNENEAVFETYYDKNSSDDVNKKAYERFYKDLSKYLKVFTPLDYTEWEKINQRKPLRIYDYLMESSSHEESELVTSVSESEIDHTILQTLVKALSEKGIVRIDTKAIEDCLECVHNYDIEDFEPIQTPSDIDSNTSQAEQDAIITNTKYVRAKEKLEKLDFII